MIKRMEDRGWTCTATGSGHLRFTHPQYGVVHQSKTPSDSRSGKNFAAQVKRAERSS